MERDLREFFIVRRKCYTVDDDTVTVIGQCNGRQNANKVVTQLSEGLKDKQVEQTNNGIITVHGVEKYTQAQVTFTSQFKTNLPGFRIGEDLELRHTD